MRGILDLELLNTFVAVVETGSFTAAAPRVGRSQSAVSMQMQRLEQLVGKQLVVRTPKAVVPNATGSKLLPYARRLLALSSETWTTIACEPEVSRIRLGVPDDYAASLLPKALGRFASDHPQIAVDLVCESSKCLNEAIRENRVDVAIVTRAADQPIEVLRRERLVWVSSRTHAQWYSDPLPVALFESGTARSNTLKALEKAGRAYRCTYSSASLLGLVTVVQTGLSIAALALCSVPESLRIIPDNEGLPQLRDLEIGILMNPSCSLPAAEQLRNSLRRDLAV
ncbi:LysR substrate-binding domain-containing protein [Rhizobium sp. BR 362]|uniref:LysR substrate-binding domain-containing protein n=1 Tax=Rhizobium sp. BR 362 TaxID=3040670 RepID=UPI002F4092A8